jgi:dTDP-4-amino-4,6-dideoxygalactose transaminase
VFHQYTLQLKNVNRDEVSRLLTERKIPNMLYYPVPSHKQKMLASFGGADYQLPVTDMLQECVISLPIHTEFTEEELAYIVKNVNEVIDELTKA